MCALFSPHRPQTVLRELAPSASAHHEQLQISSPLQVDGRGEHVESPLVTLSELIQINEYVPFM